MLHFAVMQGVVPEGVSEGQAISVQARRRFAPFPRPCTIACNKRRACTPAAAQSLRMTIVNGSGTVWFVCSVLLAKSYV